jgi:hypothetical protein
VTPSPPRRLDSPRAAGVRYSFRITDASITATNTITGAFMHEIYGIVPPMTSFRSDDTMDQAPLRAETRCSIDLGEDQLGPRSHFFQASMLATSANRATTVRGALHAAGLL